MVVDVLKRLWFNLMALGPRRLSALGLTGLTVFLLVAASPLTRSSHHAGDDFAKLRAARETHLAKRA